ncbi:putative elks delta-like protein [Leptomonas seymouri]|uniref:Putative elks delta-like protein n=1 Tax=Leptomonas seymouri TaxID=5684 RepID=A0A0N1IAJ8_LEPSE|nr:putative elks delta-like protein [Leptomonas seymouri]|eukprot:KPI89401.1 putative elks delta-like protein [Leptomonas seymouri]
MAANSQQQSIKELRRELQCLEDSLMEREEILQRKQKHSYALNTQLADERAAADAQEEARAAANADYRNAARTKQVLENGQSRSSPISYSNREGYVGQLMELDESRKGVENDIGELSSYIKALRERKMDAQKRLTVVRLMSMLDDLQILLKKKVFGPNEGEEARAQELLKTIQELSRERERTLNLLAKKEREMGALIELKKRRIEELRSESSRNACAYGDSNNAEARNVVERIQAERHQLLQEIERLERANSRMADVLIDTKYTAQSAIKDRGEALSGNAAMSASRNPEKESKQLRERIQRANADRLMYTRKTEEVQNNIDVHTAKYNARMSKLRREILFYQDESSRFEKENQNLKMLCDTLAASIVN